MAKEWSQKVKELEKRCDEIDEQLRIARKEWYAAMLAEAGVAAGDIVRGKNRYKGEVFRVAEVDVSSWRVWVIGNPRKKDGTFGTARRNLYSEWEKVAS